MVDLNFQQPVNDLFLFIVVRKIIIHVIIYCINVLLLYFLILGENEQLFTHEIFFSEYIVAK